MKKINLLKLNIITILSLVFFATPVFSAQLYFEEDSSGEKNPNQIVLHLKIDTQGEEINAVQGEIVFPEDILTMKRINEGNSIINFWIENPVLNSSSIAFSGIVPNGFKEILSPISGASNHGEIITLIFEAKKSGSGLISLKDVKVLENDGQGTELSVTISNFPFSISLDESHGYIDGVENTDVIPPERFEIEISKDPNLFEGKYFIVFETKDKQSGIFLYKVREGNGDYVVAQSPYLLKDQSLTKQISVQAVDKSGNTREEYLNNQNTSYTNLTWLFILFLLVVVSFYVKIKKRNGNI